MNGYAVYLLIVAFGVGWYLMDTGNFIYFRFRITQTILVAIAFVLTIVSSKTEWLVIITAGIYLITRLLQEVALGVITISVIKKEKENDKEV